MLLVGSGSGTERAWIFGQSVGQVVLDRKLPLLETETSVRLTRACRGSFDICDSVFGNRGNFVGAPNAEVLNPFVGDGVQGDK